MAYLLVVVVLVEFRHELKQPLAVAAENVEHLQQVLGVAARQQVKLRLNRWRAARGVED